MENAPVEAGTVRPEDIQERSRRFASLRSAQRALTDALHPQELQRTVEQGRAVLVDLQAMSLRLKEAGDDPAPERSELEPIDRRLDDISARVRETLGRITISELRASLPLLSSQQPETVRGLIDVVLEGDTENEKTLRLLEYLVTLLACEERGGRRVVARQPLEAAPRLGAYSERRIDAADPAVIAAERMFERAREELLEDQDLGLLRDRVRRYKEELGGRILHPRVLAAAVAYNVAMWNRLADVIEGSHTLDRLAEDLLQLDDEGPAPTHSIFDSAEFGRLVSALRMRLAGDPNEDGASANLVAGFELGSLGPVELELFEVAEDDHPASLVRYAVTLGLVVRHRPRLDSTLEGLGIDVSILDAQWLREVAREMMATARKLLAQGQYVEASRLLELKTRHLGIRPSRAVQGGDAPLREGPVGAEEGQFRSDLPLFRATAMVVGLGIALLASAALLWPREPQLRLYSSVELAEISPMLVSGHRDSRDGRTRFVGVLDPAWEDLDAEARNAMAESVGIRLVDDGVEGVVLVDDFHRIQARIENGTVVELVAQAPDPDAADSNGTPR